MEPYAVNVLFALSNSEAITIMMSIILLTISVILLGFGYLFIRLISGFSSQSEIQDTDFNGLRKVEDALSYKKAAQQTDEGFISAVSYETRRAKRRLPFRGPPRDGLCVTITVHVTEAISAISDKATRVELWFAIPPALNNESKLEQFFEFHDVPPDDPFELVGKAVPVRFNDEGEWETAWFEEWKNQQRNGRSIRDRLRLDRDLLNKVMKRNLQAEDDSY